MKKIFPILFIFCSLSQIYSQNTRSCEDLFAAFDTYSKNNRYDEAYKTLMQLRQDCSRFSRGIYMYGDKVLEYKIENSKGDEKVAHINDLILLYEEYHKHFASKYPKEKMSIKKAETTYIHRAELGKNDIELYEMFDEIFTNNKRNFQNPKSLYFYFTLITKMYINDKLSAKSVFTKHDAIKKCIQAFVDEYKQKIELLELKEKSNIELNKTQLKYKKYYEQSLSAFVKIDNAIFYKLKQVIK